MKRGHKRPIRVFKVASRFKKMVESTRYKHSPYTARAAVKVPTIRKAVLKHVSKKIHQECKSLCSKSHEKSILRSSSRSAADIKNFQWHKVTYELRNRAPTLYHVLCAACYCMRSSKDKRKQGKRVLPLAAAILLKGRNQFLCRAHKVLSTILYAGHCSKMVYIRLKFHCA